MISLPLLIHSLGERAKALKEAAVAEASSPSLKAQAIPPIVSWERAGIEVAAALAPAIDRDTGLILARLGAQGFSADAVVFGFDSFTVTTMTNPATGKEWAEGEVQQLAERDPERAHAVLGEALIFVRVARKGAVQVGGLPYRVQGRSITWLPTSRDAGAGSTGFVVEELTAAFRLPTALRILAEKAVPVDDRSDAQRVADRATVRAMCQMGAVVWSDRIRA